MKVTLEDFFALLALKSEVFLDAFYQRGWTARTDSACIVQEIAILIVSNVSFVDITRRGLNIILEGRRTMISWDFMRRHCQSSLI